MWKQPIPTNVVDMCQGDKFAATIFILLLLRTSNKDGVVYTNNGDSIHLKRGQCVCGRVELGEFCNMTSNQSIKVQRVLEKLEKVYKLLNKQKTRNGTVVTILNYDSLTSFEQTNEQSMNNQRTNSEQTVNTNKSIKSVESENKRNTSKSFSRFWTAYPKKEKKKQTYEIWKRKKLDSKVEEILVFIEKAKLTDRWKRDFIKQPTAFLNGECWEDDLGSYGSYEKKEGTKKLIVI